MDISTYRKDKGLTLEAFGALVGKSKPHMHQIESDMRCSAKLALEIERVSEGAISAAALNTEIASARGLPAADASPTERPQAAA